MIKYSISALFLCTAFTLQAQNNIYLETDFNKGIPANFTLRDYDQNPIDNEGFKMGITSLDTNSWFTYIVDNNSNQSALSFSRGLNDAPVNNWMITPSVHITSGDAYLKWEAKAIHYDFRDGYKIMISETDMEPGSFKEVFSIGEENYDWTHHFVSLKAYKGKDIYVAFVNNSKQKYMLAIDNLFIGIPQPGEFEVEDESPRFVGNINNAVIKGKIRNLGGKVTLSLLECKLDNNEAQQQQLTGRELLPGEEISFDFSTPVEVGKVAHYSLHVTSDAHTNKEIVKDSIICSYYPRTLVAEEFTGTWCNNCPDGTVYMNKIKKRYKNELISIAGHCTDKLSDPVYEIGLRQWLFALPGFLYNRNGNFIDYSFKETKLPMLILKPTEAVISITADYDDKNHKTIRTQAKASFMKDIDNATGRYRIGYALLEKSVTGYKQSNTITTPQGKEYYYLPSEIPANLIVYHDVARGLESAFNGVENSLPASIMSEEEYTFDYTFTIPESVNDSNNVSVIAFVLDTKAGSILNAWEVRKPKAHPAGIEENKELSDIKIYQNKLAQCIVLKFPIEANNESALIQLIGLDGSLLFSLEKNDLDSEFSIPANGFKGCYIIKIIRKNQIISKKLLLD